MAHPFTIQLAEKKIEILPLSEHMEAFCKEYVCPGGASDFSVQTSPEDLAFERERAEGGPYSDAYLETLAVYRHICDTMPAYDTFLFHGSAVAVDGEAFLFTAPSGTGKSTHARLWREVLPELGHDVVMINDDKPLLRRVSENEESIDTFLVYGTPWDGKHRLSTNTSAPLKGIALLERGTENRIEHLSKAETFPKLLQQTYRPQDAAALAKTLGLLEALGDSVPLYRLTCNMERDAARTSYFGMTKEKPL